MSDTSLWSRLSGRIRDAYHSLITRAVLLAALVMLSTGTGIVLVAAKQHEQIYRQTVDSSNQALTANLADRLLAPLADGRTSDLFFELLDLEAYPSVLYARVFDANGDMAAQYLNPSTVEAAPIPPPVEPDAPFGISQSGPHRRTYLPIAGPDEPLGRLLIITDFAGPLEASVARFVRQTAILVAAAMLVTFLVVVLVVRHSLRPLSSLSRLARRITETADLSARTRLSGRDEIGTVARSIDRMLDTVDEASRERDRVLGELEDRGDQLFRAITQLEDANRELEQLANYDGLTAIPNRTLCTTRIRSAVERARRDHTALAVLFLDLDQFKGVNDSLGHDVGDDLLVAVSRRIQEVLSTRETLARLGGDEFVVLAEGIADESDAIALAQRVIAVFDEPFPVRRWQIATSTSIGIALGPADADTPEALMQHADAAMHQAKRIGGASYAVFREELRERLLRRLRLALDLRTAIRRNELSIHYQPKIDVESGRLIGFEGLLRWLRRGNEPVMPDEFVPIAESIGVISDLSLWVFEQGAQEIGKLRALRPELDLRVAFNVSPVDLQREQFVNGIRQLVADGTVDPSWIEIELTESTLMEDPEQAERLLRILDELGFTLAIDDFGTGYSALNYLTRIPLKLLKIDKTFVDRALESAEARAVVRSVISLCREIGLKVCAEGVETDAQETYLRSSGIDMMQGYRFGKPVPIEIVTEQLASLSDGVLPHPAAVSDAPGAMVTAAQGNPRSSASQE